MTASAWHEPLRLLGRRLSPAFERQVRVLPAGSATLVEGASWEDSLVEVAAGEIELEFINGARRHFEAGDVLWLDGLPLRLLHNPSLWPAVLVTIRRRSR